jgi:formylglycine-generating enzyme required for sulfatase activity
MASVPGGSFAMGGRKGITAVKPFCLDVTEVTADAYAACVGAGQCRADHPGAHRDSSWATDGPFTADARCNYGASGRGNHPMNCVEWAQASAYCHAQDKRLPTAAEWVWAARGEAEGRRFPWGNASPDAQLCWSGKQKRSGTCPVGSFPEGDAPGGIHDLSGNVWEWASDVDPADSDSHGTPNRDVCGGGSWADDLEAVVAIRGENCDGNAPLERGVGTGFRCAR